MTESTTVNATFPTDVQPVTFKYRFNKDDVGNKRPTVEIAHNVLNLNGIKAILELDTTPKNDSEEEKARVLYNKNQQELLLEATQDMYSGPIKDWVSADAGNDAKSFEGAKYTWAIIANLSKEDRRSSAIPKEQWDAFAVDYATVMKTIAGLTSDQITAAVTVFSKKFAPVKTNKPVIEFLKGQLALYVQHTQQGDSFVDIIELLARKADEFLKDKSAEDLVGNLGMPG